MTRRAAYLAASLSRLEPWRAEGISRRTWYRRQGRDAGTGAEIMPLGTGPSIVGTGPRVSLGTGAETKPFGTGPRPFVPPVTLILSAAELETARARVEELLAEMGAQNEAARDWWRKSPYDRAGNLTIRSIVTGETSTIRLSKRGRPH
jgi:hypothetical protein